MQKSLPPWESVPSTFRKRQRRGPKTAEIKQDLAKNRRVTEGAKHQKSKAPQTVDGAVGVDSCVG